MSPSSATAGGPTPTLLSSSTPTAELSFRRFSLPVAPDPTNSPASAVSVYSSLNNNSSNGIPTPRPFSQSFSLPSTNAHFAQKYGTYVPLSSFKTSARKNSVGGHFADAAAAGPSLPGSQMADGHFPQAPVPVTAPVMVSAPKKYPVDFVAWASMD
ncbi:hypothetical protein HDU77_011515 [Chytriomyces hyalinus]|nr:hypothetical protein HDU77_011515 [Chytriomyces hyalinus]